MTTGNMSVYYPSTNTLLNGSLSTDDYKIVKYHWSQLSGPKNILLNGLNKPVLHVGQLHIKSVSPTLYVFLLTVVDYRNLSNSTIVSVLFHKGKQLCVCV